MSDLTRINHEMRTSAIEMVLRNHPFLLGKLITEDGQFNTGATPEKLDLDEPADILVRIAWDIWNGGGETEFEKILTQLPQDDFIAFIDSMTEFLRLRKKIHFSYITGSEND